MTAADVPSAAVSAPRFEHLGSDVLGIGTPAPRLSWRTTAPQGWEQVAYEVWVAREGQTSSSRTESADSVLVPWPQAPLASRERAVVQVRVFGRDGSASDWSPPGVVEAGLLEPTDWISHGVQPEWSDDASEDLRRPPLLRRSFHLAAPTERARLYVTAHGVYEIEINGARVGADALNPGWTVYQDRLRYHSYDVTGLLRPGENVIGAWLGDGWWRGRLGFDGGTLNVYGEDIALLAQLEIEQPDGDRVVIASDEHWRAHPSPILYSSLYLGEAFDVSALPRGWSCPGFDDEAWSSVRVAAFAYGALTAPEAKPVRCLRELSPVSVRPQGDESLLVDFGQNFTGRVRLRATRGVTPELTIRHAEVLQEGRLYTRTLRAAESVDRHLGSTGGIDWEPRFTVHGFRYAQIEGFSGDPEDLEIIGRSYQTDMDRTGRLETSDPRLNRLHDNVLWSMRSNFVDIPTDCPQRDERLGWTGDVQVFAPTASYLYDCAGMLGSWLRDVAREQARYGTVPWFVPVIPGGPFWSRMRPGAVWGDAAVLVPWVLWQRFGDVGLLAAQYDSARAWVDQVARLAGPSHLWNTGVQLGDWLDPTAPPEDPARAMTDPYLVATAYFAHSARRLSEIAGELGRDEDEEHYRALAERVRAAFLAEWGDGEGRLTNRSQTAYALALEFDLFPDDAAVQCAGEELAALVRGRGNRVGVGFAGVNVIADALARTGHLDAAYDLLMAEESPSWLSMVNKGATTIWERWDSLLDDGTVNSGDMTSFNHYALGSIADWMHRWIGGIQPIAPGYRRVRISPRPGGGLTWARAMLETAYGTVSTHWRIDDDGAFWLETQVPVGVRAEIRLPDGQHLEVGSGLHALRCTV